MCWGSIPRRDLPVPRAESGGKCCLKECSGRADLPESRANDLDESGATRYDNQRTPRKIPMFRNLPPRAIIASLLAVAMVLTGPLSVAAGCLGGIAPCRSVDCCCLADALDDSTEAPSCCRGADPERATVDRCCTCSAHRQTCVEATRPSTDPRTDPGRARAVAGALPAADKSPIIPGAAVAGESVPFSSVAFRLHPLLCCWRL